MFKQPFFILGLVVQGLLSKHFVICNDTFFVATKQTIMQKFESGSHCLKFKCIREILEAEQEGEKLLNFGLFDFYIFT